MGDNTEHKKLGGSKIARAMACKGSIYMGEVLPEKESGEAAREGTLFHNIVEDIISGFLLDGRSLAHLIAEHETRTDCEEMREHIKDCVLRVQEVIFQIGLNNIERAAIEKMFILSEEYGIGGSADIAFIVVAPDGARVLIIWDHKYGRMPVEVLDPSKELPHNPQLATYAVCADATEGWGPIDRAVVYIYQPRYEHPDGPLRRVKLTREDLDTWKNALLDLGKECRRQIAEKAPEFNPGSHCKWCIADGQCEAQYSEKVKECGVDFAPVDAPVVLNPTTLSHEQKESIVLNAKGIKDFVKAVEGVVESEMKSGVEYKSLKFVRGRASYKVVNPEEAAKHLIEIGMEDPYEKKLLGITAIKKAVGAKEAENFRSQFMEKSEGSLSVVGVDDRRKAVEFKPSVVLDFEEGKENESN